MARLTLPLALLALIALGATASAEPAAPVDRDLEAESAALPTPSLATRLQARAAAYRVVLQAADQLGFDADDVEQTARAQRAPVVVAARTARD